MAINREGYYVEVYDTITADSIEETDQILHENDPIEVTSVVDSGEAIMVKGYSHMTGDSVVYLLTADTTVDLWRV